MADKTLKVHCNTCGHETNHKVLHEVRKNESQEFEDNFSIEWGTSHQMLSCCGCDTISLQIESWCTENTDAHGQLEVDTLRFPAKTFRPKPKWLDHPGLTLNCPQDIVDLLDEVYVCLQNGCTRATAMVIRALLEQIFIATVGDNGTFTKNVEAFEKAGNISLKQKEFIMTALDAGHATMHRGFNPSKEDLTTIVDISENLMEILFIQKSSVDALRKRIPARKTT